MSPMTQGDHLEQAIAERYERLPIEQIVPSKTNPRTHFDETYLAELAGSIAEKGVVQPILVRELLNGEHSSAVASRLLGIYDGKISDRVKFEIVAGECRYRASLQAKQTHIPAVIRSYTNEQVLELQLIENIHRKDLTALEQAAGYRALIKANPDKHSAASIAQRIGMSEAWVWDRLKLNDLIPEAKALLDRDRMSTGHAILIARLKRDDQSRVIDPGQGRNGYNAQAEGLWQYEGARMFDDELVEDAKAKKDKYHGLKTVSVRELEGWIKTHIRFDVEHAAKAQPLTFEPVLTRVTEAAAEPGRGKKVISITHEYRVADDARDDKERTYGSQSWQRADGKDKSKTCEHSVLGVVVAGSGQGETLQVCVARDKCRVHFGAVIKQKEKSAKLRETGKSKQAAKVEKKSAQREERQQQEAEAREEAVRKTWTASVPSFEAAVVEKVKALPIGKVINQFVRRSQMKRALTAICGARQPRTADEAMRVLLLNDAINGLADPWQYHRERKAKRLKDLGVDVAAILKEHQPKPAAAAPAKKKAS